MLILEQHVLFLEHIADLRIFGAPPTEPEKRSLGIAPPLPTRQE
jgi:hypothetical protein